MELIGLALPALIDLINRKVENSDVRFWMSLWICIMVGAGLNYLETSFIYENAQAAFDGITSSVMMVFGLSQISYKALYEDSSLQKKVRGE